MFLRKFRLQKKLNVNSFLVYTRCYTRCYANTSIQIRHITEAMFMQTFVLLALMILYNLKATLFIYIIYAAKICLSLFLAMIYISTGIILVSASERVIELICVCFECIHDIRLFAMIVK